MKLEIPSLVTLYMLQHQVTYADGQSAWSRNDSILMLLHKDDLLTFYFSDNDKSITGACVEFKFTYVTISRTVQIHFLENLY